MEHMKELKLSNPFQAPVFYVPETESTMEEARAYVRRCAAGGERADESADEREGCPDKRGISDGTTIVTGFQSGGRGRIS
ncbi:MAG: hypothetical protein R6V67_02515, partial [Spirochaetia bacterium]